MTFFSFRHVFFGYSPGRPILQDVTFDLRPGRIAALLGPNGAGKTTLLALALGWLRAWKGEIYLEGIPLHALSPRERSQRMALVPQTEHTPFDYTVLEYVLMGRAPHLPFLDMPSKQDIEIALGALERVGLAHLAEHPVPTLSGGERQLMLIARALAQITSGTQEKNRLLLLDEPTSHLDLRNKARIIEILRLLRAIGTTILMTNHEPDVVLATADDILLMEPGTPPQFGPLEEVFTPESLSRVYGIPIRLIQVDGYKRVIWT